MAKTLGERCAPLRDMIRESGRIHRRRVPDFNGLDDELTAWMSHGDLLSLPRGLPSLAGRRTHL